jgi:predicted RNase H-like HicB family nuclease
MFISDAAQTLLMSTDVDEGEAAPSTTHRITLIPEEDGWTARDEATGVASCGDTRQEALAMLDEAVALHRNEIGEEPTEEELRELGVDPEAAQECGEELPPALGGPEGADSDE